MRKALVFLGVVVVCTAFATEWIIGGGVTFLNISGWNISTGLLDRSYSIEAGFDFDIGRTIEGTATNLYNLEMLGKIPLYRIEGLAFGPALSLMYGNFPVGSATDTSWKATFSAGVFGQYEFENISFSFGFLYPFVDNFDFTKAVYASAKFFIQPPEGKKFIDKLFVGVDMLSGRVRLMVGLAEPF
ncbi:MAG: hypothetical protein WHT65_02695 [Pseudothermotoga sp.]